MKTNLLFLLTLSVVSLFAQKPQQGKSPDYGIAFYANSNLYEASLKGQVSNKGNGVKVKKSKLALTVKRFTYSTMPKEILNAIPYSSGMSFYSALQSLSDANQWVVVEKVIDGDKYQAFLYNKKLNTKKVVFTNEQCPDKNYAFIPIAWNGNCIYFEAIIFGSDTENEGIWSYNINSKRVEKLKISDRYFTTPLISPDGKYFIYSATKEANKHLHSNATVLMIYNIAQKTERELYSAGNQTVSVVGWVKGKISSSDLLNMDDIDQSSIFPSDNSSQQAQQVGFKLPWPSGTSYCVTRTGSLSPNLAFPTTCAASACSSTHTGDHGNQSIDFGIPLNTNILAVASGTVVFAWFNANGISTPGGGYGNLVKVRHSDNTYTYYAHFNAIGVKVGDVVSQGCILGKSGSTGGSTGPHLHFEWRDVNDARYNNSLYWPVFSEYGCTPNQNKQYTSQNSTQTCTSNFALNCSNATSISCGQSINGQTTGKLSSSNNVTSGDYSTVNTNPYNSWSDPGPEDIYQITLSSGATATATLSNMASGLDLDVFFLSSCSVTSNPGNVTVSSTSSTITNATAGTYYILVDGSNSAYPSGGTQYGHYGAYTLSVTCSGGCAAPSAPTANSASNVAQTSFQANWGSVSGATSYRLDVSTSSSFASFVSGYNDLNVGNVTSYNVTGLTCNTTYYYRVRAYSSCASSNSSTITQATASCCSLPPNDACAGTTLTVGTSCGSGTSGSVICATATSGLAKAACDNYSGTPHLKDVWYTFSASSTATYTITATPTSTSTSTANLDIVLALYTGSCGSLTPVANGCSDSGGGSGSAESITLQLTAGTYRVRVYDYGNTEPTTGSFSICVYSSCSPPAQPGTISGTTTVCENGLHTYSISAVSGATGYTWTLPATWSDNGSTTTSINTSVGSSGGTISVTANNSCGSSSPRTLAVTVNQLPAQPSTISGATTVCQGNAQTYSVSSVSGATSYTWSLPAGWSGSSTTNSISATPGSSGGTISVTVNNSCGSSSPRTLSVSMGTLPAQPGSITGTTTVCSGTAQTYSISAVSGATSYTWSYSGGGTPSGTGTSVSLTPTSSGTLSVVANNSCGSSTQRTLSITVNPLPSQPSAITGSASVCSGTSQPYSINAVSGATSYTWSYSGGGTPSGTGTSVSLTPTSSGTLTVVANNSCGSSSQRTLAITVNSVPTQPGTITGNNSICSGTLQPYSISAVSGATSYTWAYSGSGSPSGTNTSTSFSPTSSGTLSVVANNSCGSSSQRTLAITVNQTPSVTVNPPSVSICSGGSGTTLQATGSAQSYSWSPSTGLNTTAGQIVTANPSSNTTYTVTASNGNCSATATSAVTVSNQITASITPANPVICGSGSISLSATPGTAYVWSGPNNFNGNTQTVSVSSGGSYSVTVTNPGGCVGNATATITVTQNPALLADAGANQVIQSGDSAQLGGSPTASGGTSPYTYLWNPTTALDNASAANPYANPTTGSITYNLTVTDSKGCSATDNVSVTVSTGCQTYVLDSLSMNIPHDSATYSIYLTTGAGCPWTVLEGCSWLSFTNTSGSGTESLIFTVEENTLASPRTCYVNVQGNILIITQGQAAPCLVPVSDFTASQQAIFAGNSVTFSDNSTNTPSQWEWTFNGGNPSTSIAQNPTVTYPSGGLFDVTLKATNTCGNNTVTKTNYINVIGTVGIDNISFDHNISIFPNPNNGTFRIVTQGTTHKAVQLKLFSAIGQLIYSEQILPIANKIEKDVSVGNIAAGVYLLQLTINNKPVYKKLIIE